MEEAKSIYQYWTFSTLIKKKFISLINLVLKDHGKIQVTIISVNIVIRKWINLNIEINNKYLRIKSIKKLWIKLFVYFFSFSWFIACCILMIDRQNYCRQNLYSSLSDVLYKCLKHWIQNIDENIQSKIQKPTPGFIVLKLFHRFGRSKEIHIVNF